MPNKQSPKKMLRRDIKARALNKSQMSNMRTFRKKFEHSLVSGDDTESSFRKAQSLVARAGRKGLIPKGRASRIISRMMQKKASHENANA
jgi:ribosomal protein S20